MPGKFTVVTCFKNSSDFYYIRVNSAVSYFVISYQFIIKVLKYLNFLKWIN